MSILQWYEYSKDKTVEIIVNNYVGDFELSVRQLDIYKENFSDTKLINCINNIPNNFIPRIIRSDPRLYKAVKKSIVENDRSKYYTELVSYEIPLFMLEYYDIDKYDGMESVVLQIDKFKFSLIKEFQNNIRHTTISSEEKLLKFDAIMEIANTTVFNKARNKC